MGHKDSVSCSETSITIMKSWKTRICEHKHTGALNPFPTRPRVDPCARRRPSAAYPSPYPYPLHPHHSLCHPWAVVGVESVTDSSGTSLHPVPMPDRVVGVNENGHPVDDGSPHRHWARPRAHGGALPVSPPSSTAFLPSSAPSGAGALPFLGQGSRPS